MGFGSFFHKVTKKVEKTAKTVEKKAEKAAKTAEQKAKDAYKKAVSAVSKKDKAAADVAAASKATDAANKSAAIAAVAIANDASSLNAFADSVSASQLKMAKYDSALNKQESTEQATASFVPQSSALQSIDASKYITQPSITEKTNQVVDNYHGKFEFIQFSNDGIPAYKNSCVAPNEYTNNTYNMTLLDSNNLHTPESCKKNASLQNKGYYALVKPENAQAGSNLYKCYVSDTAPSRNEYASVTVWPSPKDTFGKNVSSLNLDENGDLYVNYANGASAYYLTNHGKKFNTTTTTTKYYMLLKDSGNVEVHKVSQVDASNTRDEIIWQLFTNINVQNAISALLPVVNPAWATANNDTLSAVGSISNISSSAATPTNGLTSPSGYFKLEVVDGTLQLKASIFACRSEDVTYAPTSVTDNQIRMYTTENKDKQAYYVYQLNKSDPLTNQKFYAVSANGYNVLMPIDQTNPSLTLGTTYTSYAGYIPSSATDHKFVTKSNVKECQRECSNDPACTQVFVKPDTKSKVKCTLSTSSPVYIPDQKNPSNKDSTLYIRNYKMNLSSQQNKDNVPIDFVTKKDRLSYSTYTIGNTIASGTFSYGNESIPSYTAMIEQNKKLQWGTGKTEGFDTHGYYNPSEECNIVSGAGCQPMIENKQIKPLMQIANDYNAQIQQMTQYYTDISNNIDVYNANYQIVNGKAKYDFSANIPFTTEDNSIQTAMLNDTKQLALQQNNLAIAGSILTSTLFITAIYLGM